MMAPPAGSVAATPVETTTSVVASSLVSVASQVPPLAFSRLWDKPVRQAVPSELGAWTPVALEPVTSLRETLHVSHAGTSANDYKPSFSKRPRVVGHRGALYDHLENTRAGFLKCKELNCDAVELDVFCLEDNTVIVFHGGGDDSTPGELTDYCLNKPGVGILDLKTYQETQHLEFNPNHAEFPCPKAEIAGAHIPTLDQVLQDLKGSSVEIKIELKGPNTVQPVLDIVERLDMTSQCSYSCFHHERLAELRALRPDKTQYPTAALFDRNVPANYVQRAHECGATAVHLQYDTCTVERIRAIHQAGMQSMAWFRGPVGMTADSTTKYHDIGSEDEACYQAVMDTGVDELCVNKPDLLLNMLNRVQVVGTTATAI